MMLSLAWIFACSTEKQNEENSENGDENEAAEVIMAQNLNQLTEEEQSKGWVLLFDGKSFNNWKIYNKDSIGKKWQIEDGILTFIGDAEAEKMGLPESEGGYLTTEKVYGNYEFKIEWKISPGGNSGIIYHAIEDEKYDYPYETGPEMQILDSDAHPDGKIDKHRSGDLYDLIECSEKTVKPVGEWNEVKIVSNNGHIEHWLNGVKVIEYEIGSERLDSLIRNSKWKDFPDFLSAKEGHISLQDHDDRVWFRNIKIKEL